MSNSKNRITKFINKAMAIDAEDAFNAGSLGYIARCMVNATLPHSKPKAYHFQRKNGLYTLTMIANPLYGLPYGALPRLLIAWITTEAARQKSPILELGKTLSTFLKKLDLSRQGGSRGDITRLRIQMLRLFTTQISCTYHNSNNGEASGENFLFARSYNLWWKPITTNQNKDFRPSTVTLAKDFFEELINRPVPVDLRVLHLLRRSPLQMDIYSWLTYWLSFLKQSKIISWCNLKNQFGADYGDDAQGVRSFKSKFLKALKKVLVVYSTAKVQVEDAGLRLLPSQPHIKKIYNNNNKNRLALAAE